MCKDAERHAFLRALPKCEHHVHIEGTLTPELLFTLMKRNNISLPSNDPAFASPITLLERYQNFTSLDDFLQYYYIAMSSLRQSVDFEDLAWAYFATAASDGCRHAEISFDIQAHLSRGLSLSLVLSGLEAARARAHRDLDMSTTLICCFLRHLPASSALDILSSPDFQTAALEGQIKGIGLDSSEKPYPPELFVAVFQKAKELGLRLTAHAGEEGPAENIIKSLDLLQVERIDHGIRLADDDSLVEQVAAAMKRNGSIILTMCPLSNVRLRCVEKIAHLPIRKFLDTGVKFSINSDDGAYFGGFVLDNYCAVDEAFHLENKDWARICRDAIDGSWCDEGRRRELVKLLQDVIVS